jgi:hypothetical protein
MLEWGFWVIMVFEIDVMENKRGLTTFKEVILGMVEPIRVYS